MNKLLLLFLLCFSSAIYGQQKSSALSVKGSIKDVEQNLLMASATVSIFSADSNLVAFQLSDSYGNFSFKGLNSKLSHYMEVSTVGYTTVRKRLIPPKDQELLDLGTIEMKPRDILLKEVSIGISPVTMNGDTLEFNPAAFKLDTNSVLEDLLKKIPNVTVWNDGQITVNGREVKSLLVNGRPFFGTNFKVATQNLPKDIIQKIQVYRKVEKGNSLDSIMEMNIALKKGKDVGYFGKLSGGFGSRKRYESEGNINFFSKRMQLSLAGGRNNTNKIADNVGSLLANSTYKGNTNQLDYQSDFRIPGLNKTLMAGAKLMYNFLNTQSLTDKNVLNVEHFFQRKNNDIVSNSSIINSFNSESNNIRKSENNELYTTSGNRLNANYDLSNDARSFYVNGAANIQEGRTTSSIFESASNNMAPLSTNNTNYEGELSNDRLSFNTGYIYHAKNRDSYGQAIGFIPFSIKYSGDHYRSSTRALLRNSYVSFVTPEESLDLARKYDSKSLSINNRFDASFENVERLLFGKRFNLIGIGLSDELNLTNNQKDDQVSDLRETGYIENRYLTNNLKIDLTENQAKLAISKSYGRRLSDGFEKSLSLKFEPKLSTKSFVTQSFNAFQNINRNYTNILPDASIGLYNHIFGKHRSTLSLGFNTRVNIPTIEQIAPLVDSAQIYYQRRGNLSVDQEQIQRLDISFDRANLKTKNTFAYNAKVYYQYSNNKIIDSTFIAIDNRQIAYATNADGFSDYGSSFELRKAVNFKSSDLKFHVQGDYSSQRLPIYINNELVYNQNTNIRLGLTAGYGYKDFIIMELRESFNDFRTRQPAFNANYRGTTNSHTFNVNFNISKKITLNSNVSNTQNRSAGVKTQNFTIWNAYLSHRFTKGANGEIKFSALDLLRQNASVINEFGVNTFTTLKRNVLQQYFLVSLAYYPRQFGKKSKE